MGQYLKKDAWLVELIESQKLASKEHLEAIIQSAYEDKVELIDAVIQKRVVDEKQLYSVIARKFGLEMMSPSLTSIDLDLVRKFGEQFCRSHMLLPTQESDSTIKLLISNPHDLTIQSDLSFKFGKTILLFLGYRSKILTLLSQIFSSPVVDLESSQIFSTDVPIEIFSLTNSGIGVDPEISKLPIIRLTKHVLAAAIEQRCDTIYLEPNARTVRVYFEVGGVKKTMAEYPARTGSLMIQRAKYLAGLDLDKTLGPQNGRARIKSSLSAGDQNFELRVSALPSSFGEKIILRLYDKKNVIIPMEKLGMVTPIKTYMDKLMGLNSGLVIFASPAANGKTTTLYSGIQYHVDRGRTVYSVENSIHFTMEGVSQMEVEEREGNTSAVLIRSALKQQPDILAVDAITDSLSAQSTVEAATGKTLVLATLKTESALSAVMHLINLNVTREVIAQALKAVVVQRLVKKICPYCKVQINPPELDFDIISLMNKRGIKPHFYRGKGCPHCDRTGFQGYTGIFEIFPITPEFAQAIRSGTSEADLKLTAKQMGIRSMVDYSLAHVVIGDTTVEEALKIIDFQRYVVSARPLEEHMSGIQPVDAYNPMPTDNQRILIAEDNPSVRAVIRSVLQTNKFQVIEARDGREALEKLKHESPDLILLDISMPRLSGLDVLKQVRSYPPLQNLPIIMLTANSQAQMEYESLERGADDYIVKPFRPELLAARIRAALRRSQTALSPQEPVALAA